MNTFVMLLLTTWAPGADSVPMAGAVPSPNFREPVWSGQDPESRPRLFGRIQGFFSRRSRASARPSPQSFPAAQDGVGGVGPVEDTLATPGPMLPPSVSPG